MKSIVDTEINFEYENAEDPFDFNTMSMGYSAVFDIICDLMMRMEGKHYGLEGIVLIDEIGRGTSTYDGVAIAWSVAEYIATVIKSRCIFATHYHELNVMTKTLPQIKNYRITISEENGHIEFLRKIVQGGASKSYGIQVAKMAGLPNGVVKRSEELMSKMQKDFSKNLAGRKKNSETEQIVDAPQLNLF